MLFLFPLLYGGKPATTLPAAKQLTKEIKDIKTNPSRHRETWITKE